MTMRVATEADREAIGRTLAGAFEHDPLWGWAFEDAERERKLAALGEVFGFCAAAALDLGWVRVTDGVEAVALWIPPGKPELRPEDAAMTRRPWSDPDNFNPGYVLRSQHVMFGQGDREPWTHMHEHAHEAQSLPAADLDDGSLTFR